MAVTDYKYAGTAANVNRDAKSDWANPSYANADDTSYTTVSVGKDTYSDWLRLTNFGFTSSDIPSGATINGIEFVIGRFANANRISDSALYLYDDGVVGSNLASASTWPTGSVGEATYGGATNMCGTSLTQADIAAATFGVQLSVACAGETDSAAVDYIKIRVYYLAVNNSAHELSSQSPTLNELKTLEVRNSTHALTSTSPAPVELATLEVNDSYHALASMADVESAYILNEDGTLVTAEDGKHVITETAIQTPTLIELKVLAVNDAAHALSSESPTLSVYYPAHIVNEDDSNLTTEDGEHILTEDAMSVDDGEHGLTSDSPTLIEHIILAVNDAFHGLISDTPTLNEAKTLAVNNGYHALSSDAPTLLLDTYSGFILTEDRDILTAEDGKHIVREDAIIFQAAWAKNSNVMIQTRVAA